MKKKEVIVNSGRSDAIKPEFFEDKYSASFVGQLQLKDRDGNWTNKCFDIYYQKTPPVKGYSNYFGIFIKNTGIAYITSGYSAITGNIIGVVAANQEIIYSRYRHDYRTSTDGSVVIDGGRDYARTNKPECLITLKIISGKFYQVEKDNIV